MGLEGAKEEARGAGTTKAAAGRASTAARRKERMLQMLFLFGWCVGGWVGGWVSVWGGRTTWMGGSGWGGGAWGVCHSGWEEVGKLMDTKATRTLHTHTTRPGRRNGGGWVAVCRSALKKRLEGSPDLSLFDRARHELVGQSGFAKAGGWATQLTQPSNPPTSTPHPRTERCPRRQGPTRRPPPCWPARPMPGQRRSVPTPSSRCRSRCHLISSPGLQ